jgi:hypothetical protein
MGQLLFGKASAMMGLGSAVATTTTKAAPMNAALMAPNAPQPPSTTMLVERRGHTATKLSNGTVLIAGGENSSGALNESEIYDPTSATFSVTGNMGAARADHSATLLADGRVLIVGGRDGAGALNTTEIFDPTTGAFASGPAMRVARAGHSATLFADGRILVTGGDANGSAEILDAALTSFSAAGTMNTARSMHSAALMLDGRVLLVGGRDAGGNALSSGEVFDGSTFVGVGGMEDARVRPLLRVLFDGKIQIIGGNDHRSLEIYDPAAGIFGGHAHVPPDGDLHPNLITEIMSSPSRAALLTGEQTITELAGNLALAAGGVDSNGNATNASSLCASSGASVTSNVLDYPPGTPVIINGRGFQANENIVLTFHEDPHVDTDELHTFTVQADANGNFTFDQYAPETADAGITYILGAKGETSGLTAQTTFTDTPKVGSVTVSTQAPNPVIAGNNATYAITVNRGAGSGSSGAFDAALSVTTALPSGATASFSASGAFPNCVGGSKTCFDPAANSLRFASADNSLTAILTISTTGATSGGTSPFTVRAATSVTDFADGGGTLVITAATVATTTTVSSSANPSVFGQSLTFTATVSRASGSPSPTGTVQFKIDTVNFGSPVALSSVNATTATVTSGATSSLTVGTHTVTADYIPAAGFSASSGTLTGGQVVNKTDSLSTVTSSVNPSILGQSVTFTATVSAVAPGAGAPTGTVQFKIDGSNFGAPVALSGGSASSGATTSLAVGARSITAEYSGDTNFNASGLGSSTAPAFTQTVNKADSLSTVTSSVNPSVFGESVTFTATVTAVAPGAGTPSGTVDFKDGATTIAAVVVLNGSGVATFPTSSLSAGVHSITAAYSGDGNFNATATGASTAPIFSQTVNQRATLTTVSSSLNPSTFGESVSFSATVVGTGAGAGNPSGGSVQFKIDGSNFGAAVPLSGGSASSGSISTLTAGNHTVEAVFTSSDGNFSNSNDLLDGGQTVNKRSSLTTVSSSLNPSNFGDSVTFTATVVSTGAGAGNPSGGSVQFKIDGSNFGAPVALVAGSASSAATTTLSVGNHPVEAIFTSTDTNFNGSADLLDGGQTVNKWTLSGFFQPVGIPNTYSILNPVPFVWNTIKGGQTVPLKFRIYSGTTELTDITAIKSFTALQIDCGTYGALGVEDPVEESTSGSTGLRYSGTPGVDGQFIQNWQTPKPADKCYRVVMTAQDNSILVSFFKAKK